jgi:hypothetical protein
MLAMEWTRIFPLVWHMGGTQKGVISDSLVGFDNRATTTQLEKIDFDQTSDDEYGALTPVRSKVYPYSAFDSLRVLSKDEAMTRGRDRSSWLAKYDLDEFKAIDLWQAGA